MAKKTTKKNNVEVEMNSGSTEEIKIEEVISKANELLSHSDNLEELITSKETTPEETLKNELANINKVEEKLQKKIEQLDKKISSSFGYVWNGQQYNY